MKPPCFKNALLTATLLFLSFCTFSQNVGINTTSPNNTLTVNGSIDVKDSLVIGAVKGTAHFDLTGNANFKGVNSNTFVNNQYPNAVNFYTGRVFNTLSPGQQTGDISFQFGGNGGGLKHYLVTRHGFDPNSNSNAFDFYVNNSPVNTGSQYPGQGNVLAMSASAFGVGIGTSNPTEKLEVAGNAKINNNLLVTGNSFLTGNTIISGYTTISGHVGIGTGIIPVEQFYVNGNAKVETNFTLGANINVGGNSIVGGNGIFNNQVNILNRLAIGTTASPGERLYVNGLAKIEGEFTATGTSYLTTLNVSGPTIISNTLNVTDKIGMGQTYLFSDYSIPPGQTMGVAISCPAGTQLLSGGGGNNLINGGADKIHLSYNGPDPNNPLNVWAIYARNTDSVARPLRIYCLCARIN